MGLIARKYTFFFACGLAFICAWLISPKVSYLPSQLILNVSSSNADQLTVYIDTGNGFRENQRQQVELSGVLSEVQFNLPMQALRDLRFDIDSRQIDTSILIQNICIKAFLGKKSTCLDFDSLAGSFQVMNSISESMVTPKGLSVEAYGDDPYFSLNLDFQGTHDNLAKLPSGVKYLMLLVIASSIFWIIYLLITKGISFLGNRFSTFRAEGFPVSVGIYAGLVCVFSIFLSGSWLIIFKSGWFVSILIFFCMIIILAVPTTKTYSISFQEALLEWCSSLRKVEFKEALIVSVLILFPLVVLVFNTWTQEFPHLGDHEYHMWGNKISYLAISKNYSVLLFSALLLVAGVVFGLLRWCILILLVFLFTTGLWNTHYGQLSNDLQGIFSRYPGGARIIAQPFIYLSYLYEWHSPLNTARIANFLSIPVWLLFLRPIFIGKQPSLSILPFAVLFFLQAEVLYLFTTSYLDIWCVIFVLLALEKLLVDEGDYAYLKSCLLLSVACAFKEPAVFIIPWFWLAGWSFKSFKSGLNHQLVSRLKDSVIVGFASVLPFIVYYIVRKEGGVSRYTVKGFEYFLTENWLNEINHRLFFHFGSLGVALLVFVVLAWCWVFFSTKWEAYRWKMICILCAIITQIFLFNWDQGGISYTGYLRFYLLELVLFFAPVILIFHAQGNNLINRKILILVSSTILLANTPKLYSAAQQLGEPDSVRNFNEHYDAPIYLPIRSLIKQAEEGRALNEEHNKSIHVNHVTAWNQPVLPYADLRRKYQLKMSSDLKCECSTQSPTVLAPFIYMAGLNEGLDTKTYEEISATPQHMVKYVKRWRQVNGMRDQCLVKLQSSCKNYYQETTSTGVVVGALGVGVK